MSCGARALRLAPMDSILVAIPDHVFESSVLTFFSQREALLLQLVSRYFRDCVPRVQWHIDGWWPFLSQLEGAPAMPSAQQRELLDDDSEMSITSLEQLRWWNRTFPCACGLTVFFVDFTERWIDDSFEFALSESTNDAEEDRRRCGVVAGEALAESGNDNGGKAGRDEEDDDDDDDDDDDICG